MKETNGNVATARQTDQSRDFAPILGICILLFFFNSISASCRRDTHGPLPSESYKKPFFRGGGDGRGEGFSDAWSNISGDLTG